MRRGDISIETLFWIILFVISLVVVFYIFVQARGQTSNLLDLIPI